MLLQRRACGIDDRYQLLGRTFDESNGLLRWLRPGRPDQPQWYSQEGSRSDYGRSASEHGSPISRTNNSRKSPQQGGYTANTNLPDSRGAEVPAEHNPECGVISVQNQAAPAVRSATLAGLSVTDPESPPGH